MSAICDVLLNFREVPKEKNVTKKGGGGQKMSIFTVTSFMDDPQTIDGIFPHTQLDFDRFQQTFSHKMQC